MLAPDVGTSTVALLLPPDVVTVRVTAPFTLYSNVYGVVPPDPVKVINGGTSPLQTVAVPVIIADGSGFTLTVTFPVTARSQAELLPSLTLTSL